MTIVQTMLFWVRRAMALAVPMCLLGGCASHRHGQLEVPEVLVSPYSTAHGDALWAVVPLANESGVSVVDTYAISDDLVAKIAEVRGVTCLPLNRTIAAIRAMGNRVPSSPEAARALANVLGVDALVLGSVTAYDPYYPPKIGLTLALFVRDTGRSEDTLDPVQLQTSYTDYSRTQQTQYLERPASVVSEHLDAANHEVEMDVRSYAVGRHDPDSALGWRGVMESMDLYTEFAVNHAVARLLEAERLRLGQPVAAKRADAGRKRSSSRPSELP